LKKALCVKVRKNLGEKTIKTLSILNLINRDLKVKKAGDFLFVPIIVKPDSRHLSALKEEIGEFKLCESSFSERKKRLDLSEIASRHLPSHLVSYFPRSFDIIGHIAIIEVPPKLRRYEDRVGRIILEAHKNVRTVLAKAGAIRGTYRLRRFRVIAGLEETETLHREHGCRFLLDPTKVYFSPRLSFEHNRVASLVREGETVIDMFAGIGPFSILIAKKVSDVKVYAIDINPFAVKYLNVNISLNSVEDKVTPILGDAREVVSRKLLRSADRVIMNLPERSDKYLDVACEALKPEGGIIHYYQFLKGRDSIREIEKKVVDIVRESGKRECIVKYSRFVKEVAPYTWQAVFDLKVA